MLNRHVCRVRCGLRQVVLRPHAYRLRFTPWLAGRIRMGRLDRDSYSYVTARTVRNHGFGTVKRLNPKLSIDASDLRYHLDCLFEDVVLAAEIDIRRIQHKALPIDACRRRHTGMKAQHPATFCYATRQEKRREFAADAWAAVRVARA